MNTDWKSFLIEQGASFKDEQLVSFVNSESQSVATLCDLSDQGIIKVSGGDAESFLQNQLTNDISHLSQTGYQESAWCSPKGRIIANFRIFKRDNSYYIIVSADLLEHVIKKLGMYVMMSKVTLEDATNSLIHFGYALNEDADKNAESEQLQNKSLSILKIAGTLPRFEILAEINEEMDDAKQLWQHLAQDASIVSNNHWLYLNIVAGLPTINEASSESWIPQMVNYIAVGGVDFKKGCYPGQEVVARLNYLGKTKRRMYRLGLDTNQLPAVGDIIYGESETEAGKILNAAFNPDGKVEALAILKIAEANKPLSISPSDQNIAISILDLPYSVNND